MLLFIIFLQSGPKQLSTGLKHSPHTGTTRKAVEHWPKTLSTYREGIVVLVDPKSFRLWELYTEDGSEVEWYPVEILSKDQEVRRLRKSERYKMFTTNEIRMNERGCVSVILPLNHVVAVWNKEGKLLYR